jgi:hypothetical protein
LEASGQKLPWSMLYLHGYILQWGGLLQGKDTVEGGSLGRGDRAGE